MRKKFSVSLRKTVQAKIKAVILRGWLGSSTKINFAAQSLKKPVFASSKPIMEAGI